MCSCGVVNFHSGANQNSQSLTHSTKLRPRLWIVSHLSEISPSHPRMVLKILHWYSTREVGGKTICSTICPQASVSTTSLLYYTCNSIYIVEFDRGRKVQDFIFSHVPSFYTTDLNFLCNRNISNIFLSIWKFTEHLAQFSNIITRVLLCRQSVVCLKR